MPAADNDANLLKKKLVEPGTIVQLSKNTSFPYGLLIVTDLKSIGVQGYVQIYRDIPVLPGQAYYIAKWDDFEIVGKAYQF